MADTRELTILKAAATRLAVSSIGGHSKPSGLTISRQPKRKIMSTNLPMQVVHKVSSPAPDHADASSGRLARSMTFAVVSLAVVPDNTPFDDAMDPYMSWAIKSLLYDYTLGGACQLIDEGREAGRGFYDDSESIGVVTTEFVVTFETALLNPESTS